MTNTEIRTDIQEIARQLLGGDPLSIPESWKWISEDAEIRLLQREHCPIVANATWSDWDETNHPNEGFYTGWVGCVTVRQLVCGKFLVELTRDYCGNCFDNEFVAAFIADEV